MRARRKALKLHRTKLAAASLALVLFPGVLAQVVAQDESGLKRRVVRSLLEFRREKVIIQEWDLSCGAAALATILNYQYGDHLSEKTIAEAMLRRTDPLRVKFRGGFSLLDLKRFAETRGYTADGYTNVGIENLVEFGPSIVPFTFGGYNHFVVFRGLIDNQVLISDPAFGKRTLTLERFQEDWLGNLAFVVSRVADTVSPNHLAPKPSDVIRPPDSVIRSVIRSGGHR